MPWRIRAPAAAFLLTPKASAMRDIGMPSAESSRSLVIAGSSQVMCQVGQFVGRRGASFGYPSVLRGCPLLTHLLAQRCKRRGSERRQSLDGIKHITQDGAVARAEGFGEKFLPASKLSRIVIKRIR